MIDHTILVAQNLSKCFPVESLHYTLPSIVLVDKININTVYSYSDVLHVPMNLHTSNTIIKVHVILQINTIICCDIYHL